MTDRNLPLRHGEHANTLNVDGLEWNVEEVTLDSSVFNNFVDGTQTVAIRVVLSRTPEKTMRLDLKNTDPRA